MNVSLFQIGRECKSELDPSLPCQHVCGIEYANGHEKAADLGKEAIESYINRASKVVNDSRCFRDLCGDKNSGNEKVASVFNDKLPKGN